MNGHFGISILSAKFGISYIRYPDSLLSGLSKIGGLMALFRLAFLFRALHKRRFEQMAEQELTIKGAGPSSKSKNPTAAVNSTTDVDSESLVADHNQNETENKRSLQEIFSMENFIAMMEKVEHSEERHEKSEEKQKQSEERIAELVK